MERGKVTLVEILAVASIPFCLVQLALVTYLIKHSGSIPSGLNVFMLLVCLWTLLVPVYIILVPWLLARFYRSAVAFALETSAAISWLGGSIAISLVLRDCGRGYYCDDGMATAVFGFLIFVIFSAVSVLEGLRWRRSLALQPCFQFKTPNGPYITRPAPV